MVTILPDLELKQAFDFFAMGNKTLNLDEYLNALKNVGIVFNKSELQALQEKEKNDFNEADFLKDYKDKMNQISKDELLKVFQEFDPESTGTMAYEVLHRALVTYGERLSKEEADRFMHLFKVKPDEPVRYNDLLEELVKI